MSKVTVPAAAGLTVTVKTRFEVPLSPSMIPASAIETVGEVTPQVLAAPGVGAYWS